MSTPGNNKAYVVKGGVKFEVILNSVHWLILKNQKPESQRVNISLRITNNNKKPLRFSRFDTITPIVTEAHGKSLTLESGRNRTQMPTESDFPLVYPGKTVTFTLNAKLAFEDDKIVLGGEDGFGGMWRIADLVPGEYHFSLKYANKTEQMKIGDPETEISHIWTGQVLTPSVGIALQLK